MQLDTNNQKFISIAIDFSRGFPFTINVGEENERTYPSLLELLNPDDIPPITEMFTDASDKENSVFEAHARFMVNGEYHWFFLSCKGKLGEFGKIIRFEGIMCDVSTYIETSGEDPVYKEFRRRHNIRFTKLKREGVPALAEVLDVQYLTGIQKPFAQPQLYSGIFDAEGKLICTPGDQQKQLKPDDFAYQKKKNIRINHVLSGSWVLCAKTQSLLDENLQLWETLVQTVSRMANAFVAVLNEMDNSQNANKMLGQNIEEQILLNNIYAIIMQSKSPDIARNSVMELIGDYFSLDRIEILSCDTFESELCWCRDYGHRTLAGIPHDELYAEYRRICSELSFTSSYFSDSEENGLLPLGVKSFAVFELVNSGSIDSMIFYQTLKSEHVWTQRERKQLRNISQIISSLMMRCETQQKLEESQNRMQQLAFYDVIYQIPNRVRLNKDMSELLQNGASGALIAFKVTNTRALSAVYGHTYTDSMLRSIAHYLEELPVKDVSVYYFANAIFMINLPGYCADDAKSFVETLIKRFSEPWRFGDSEHTVHCSMGIALYPQNGKTAEEICRAAFTASYRAREFKQNSYTFYTAALERTKLFAANLENHIKECVSNCMRGFSLLFQPAFNADDGSVCACESLVHWNDPQYGNIPNSTLIPMAENLGLTHLIDGWVLKQSCLFAQKIRESGLEDFQICVNLTAGEPQSSEILYLVQNALDESGLDAGALVLEIPVKSNIFYSDTAHILSDLKNMGVKVAVDRYGTENISLKVLKNSFVDIVNVPCSLISSFEDDFDRELAESIITLARCRNLLISIKGIEDEKQFRAVQSYCIDRVQGYYCSRPLSQNEVFELLASSVGIQAQ